jgi:ABC-2 type transport system ATP-binding protein
LAFSIAIRARGDILLLDEVLAVGDAAFQDKCNAYFESLHGKQTVILVTHSMDNVRKFCDRGILIENGKIVDEGDPDKIADEYLGLFV